jgi:hypothetical protein
MDGTSEPAWTEAQAAVLRDAVARFMADGFHKAVANDLVEAFGLDDLPQASRYGAKEALFYATLEYCVAMGGGDRPEAESLRLMAERLLRVDRNPRLRSIHAESRKLIAALMELRGQLPQRPDS